MISQQKVSPKWLIISRQTHLYTLIAQKNFKPHPMTFHSDDARKIVFSVSSGGKVFAALPSRYSMQHTVNMPSWDRKILIFHFDKIMILMRHVDYFWQLHLADLVILSGYRRPQQYYCRRHTGDKAILWEKKCFVHFVKIMISIRHVDYFWPLHQAHFRVSKSIY